MQDKITISPDTMRERARQYRHEADNVNEVIGNLDSLLSALQGEWEGESSTAYYETYKGLLQPAFQKTEDMIREIAHALETAANRMQGEDRTIASQLRL